MLLQILPMNHACKPKLWLFLICVFLLAGSFAVAQESPNSPENSVATEQATDEKSPVAAGDMTGFEDSIKPLLVSACFDCHSGEKVEGNFRADKLDPDLIRGEDLAWWLEVYTVVSKAEMPPPESSKLSDGDRARVVEWLSSQIQAAEKHRKTEGNRSSFRRLTRYEYNYALQDLLGVPWTFDRDLPAEASEEDSFENNADSLHMSVKQLEAYRQLALDALRRVTVRGDQPSSVHWSVPMKDAFDREKRRIDREIKSAREKFADDQDKLAKEIDRLEDGFETSLDRSHYLDASTGRRTQIKWDYRNASYAFQPMDVETPMPAPGSHFAVVQPGSRLSLIIELGDQLPNIGTMRVRIRASRTDGTAQSNPSLQLYFGFQSTNEGRATKRLSKQDVEIIAMPGQPEIYQWDVPLGEIEHRNTFRGKLKLGDQPNPSEYIRFVNSSAAEDEDDPNRLAILIEHVEVTAPVYDQWPPESHRNIFFKGDSSDNEAAYARQIVTDFMTRAWRRVPTSNDIDHKMQLFNRLRPKSKDFQAAVIEVLVTVLSSPKFLYVLPGEDESSDADSKMKLTSGELATRLSLFLWCSLPDKTLLELASDGRLGDREILLEQVDRMLADPRASRFGKHFVSQWLRMQPLEFLTAASDRVRDREQNGRSGDGLDEALLESMKQEPIALFEEILRNNASVLDFIDPDYLVLNERLAMHYAIPNVQGNQFRRVALPTGTDRGGLLTQAGLLTMNSDGKDSHPVKRGVWLLTNLLNDPPPPPPPAVPEIDLADPRIAQMTLKERIEDHRQHAACLSCHKKIDPWGIAFENYDAMGRYRDQIHGKPVDATSVLPNRAKLDGMDGLRKHLASQRHKQFVRATVEKMASFALGRRLDFGDRAAITDITSQVRKSGDGLATLVKSLLTSELFKAK
jgi:Protein of unknown function (DUF1592)/Protein of unknown function (DUF1588)/Protein of unknown function (DUF1585)/Protein of unknown function (DUF1587)/Protein of unknown function (DUF1595)/Planctomycete cytochrome C